MFGYIEYYNNPYKLVEACFSMVKEKYYLVEKVKECFMIDAFNINVIKQTGGKLEMLSSKVIKPKDIRVELKKKVVSCTDDKYEIKEITEEQAVKILKDAERNYASWQNYMSTSEDRGSSHLGFGGDILY